MKLRFLILSILLPLHSFGATNAFDNVKINTSFKFTPGAASGRVLTSDAVGLSSWQVVAPAGNVFLGSNNTYVVGTAQTFNGAFTNNGPTVLNGTLLVTNQANFLTRVIAGTNGSSGLVTRFEAFGNSTYHFYGFSPGGANIATLRLENSANRGIDMGYSGTTYPSAGLTLGIVGEAGWVATTDPNRPMMLGANNAMYMIFNGTSGLNSSKIGFFTNSPAFTYHFAPSLTTNLGSMFLDNVSFTVGTVGTTGSAINAEKTATASLDFPNIIAAASADLTITVTGANTNDIIMMGKPIAQDASLVTEAFVTSVNTVTVRAHNVGSLAVDQPALTYRVDLLQH